MKQRLFVFLVVAITSTFLTACCALSESPGSCVREREGSYSKAKDRIKNVKKLSPEDLDQIFAECPKPNGVFEATSTDERTKKSGGGYLLERYFSVTGFQMPATSYPGGRKWDEPIPSTGSPINILGGVKDVVWQYYRARFYPPEQFTLELRPLRPGRFRIGVTSITFGRSGEAEGLLSLSPLGLPARCENGILKVFRKRGDETIPDSELSVEAATGDIVVSRGSEIERGEIGFRFRKIDD